MNKKFKFAIAVIMIMTFLSGISAYASNIHVSLNGLKNKEQDVVVDFEYAKPINIDGISMVPVRTISEAIGMDVMWQKTYNAIVVKLNAAVDSQVRMERYAYSILEKKAQTVDNTLTPDSIIMTMYLNSDEATLHYNYTNQSGEIISYGKYIDLTKPVVMIDNGTVSAPIRPMFNYFGLWIEWNEESSTASLMIPDFINYVDAMELVGSYNPQPEPEVVYVEETITEPVEKTPVVSEEPASNRMYVGKFKITHYCPCAICNGPYGAVTAWAGALKPYYTIAVDPTVIPKLATVEIDGYSGLRRAEDCGGAIKGNRIDVAVSSHAEALRLGVVYRDVWIVK